MMLAGCGSVASNEAVSVEPAPIDLAECAVCGMVVGEQTAPRAQVVYRNGVHQHVCSVEEVRALVQSPSPLGKPLGVYVEALPVGFDPATSFTQPLPWVAVEDALFVYGAERPMVMGRPALTFADPEAADQAAAAIGTDVIRWDALQALPFNTIPE